MRLFIDGDFHMYVLADGVQLTPESKKFCEVGRTAEMRRDTRAGAQSLRNLRAVQHKKKANPLDNLETAFRDLVFNVTNALGMGRISLDRRNERVRNLKLALAVIAFAGLAYGAVETSKIGASVAPVEVPNLTITLPSHDDAGKAAGTRKEESPRLLAANPVAERRAEGSVDDDQMDY